MGFNVATSKYCHGTVLPPKDVSQKVQHKWAIKSEHNEHEGSSNVFLRFLGGVEYTEATDIYGKDYGIASIYNIKRLDSIPLNL